MVLIEIVHEILQAVSHYIFSTTEKNIRNEIVLITGSGRGLGQQIAVLFAKRGAIVVLCDTTEIGNSQTVELISAICYEQRVYSYTCDIGNRDEVDQLVKKIQSEVGDISILVNNGLFRIVYIHIKI
jgi:NAD(P)-dependent dehydrogenase (short-subunit alcohol dehydrogenase family)